MKIIDSKSHFHNEQVDILIENHTIKSIAAKINSRADHVIESEFLHVSQGWIDIGAMCWDPGHEYREDKQSLKAAAAHGGFTTVYIWPNTDPTIDNKAQYQYYSHYNEGGGIKVLPICSLTKKSKGTELAELIDLNHSGATLFSDGLVFNGSIKELNKALEYTKSINAYVLYAPSPFDINPDGQIHESSTSIALGLQGLAGASERISVQKAIALAEYAETNFVLHNISTKASLQASKSKSVSALGVAYLNLCKTVNSCEGFNTNYKVIPPLRNTPDSKALIKGVINNQITYICSNHYPLENDVKDMEFGMARFGASGIETLFSGLIMDTNLEVETIVDKLTYGPASAAGIKLPPIKEKEKANLTLFDPTISWVYDRSTCKSKSMNNPYFGKQLKGKVLAVMC
ncbi:MAG: hypothetical protein V3V00_02050 [Saprospiraceae bacterium]